MKRPSNRFEEKHLSAIRDLIESVGGKPDTFRGRLITQQILTSLQLIPDGHDTGQLKLLTRAMKEMRYAYRVFNKYRGIRKITIFGSARTPPEHPDYHSAKVFSAQMAQKGWMSITGAGDGIMKAGHEGPRKEGSFGLSIRLPFETSANTVIEGDPKLINFRYFFTRKLMFMSHADAVAIFPGGYGTQDELYESLVLVQTGRSNIVPIIMLEGLDGSYWPSWNEYMRRNLLETGFISSDDPDIFYVAPTPEKAVQHILSFYRIYHSNRYVDDTLVLRLKQTISGRDLEILNEEFCDLVNDGKIQQTRALPGERDHLDLPRISFSHKRGRYGRLRSLIDRVNSFVIDQESAEAVTS